MPKISQCDRCQRYSCTPNLVCSIRPGGPDSDYCLDFAPDAGAIAESIREGGWVGLYCGEPIPQSQGRLTQEEQPELPETHPLFIGRCPQCGCTFSQGEPPTTHLDCPCCSWVDETV